MATQYTSILKLALPVQGELSGTWGDVVNENITSMVEQAIAGRAVINTWSGNSHTLTTANGTTSESRCAMLEFTNTGSQLTGAGTVICPTATKIYIVKNTAGHNVTLKTSGGTGILVPNGRTMFLFCDGTNVLEAVTSTTSLQLGTSTVVTAVLDEDNMTSNSATSLATQQSIKAYVDASVIISNDEVTTAMLQDSAVTTAKIADDAVTTAKIADDAITAAKIASVPIAVGITSVVTSSSLTATVNTHVYVSAATQTITLPASPAIGQRVLVTVGNFTDTVVGRNGSNIMSSASDFTMDAAYLSIQFIYTDATQGWVMS
jgi:hypothetical protein